MSVYGEYSVDHEDSTILHLPRAERRSDDRSAVWVTPVTDADGLEADDLGALAGKRVILTGTLQSGGGYGMGFSACELVTTRFQRIKRLPGELP